VQRVQIAQNLIEVDGDIVRSLVGCQSTLETARPFFALAEQVLLREGRLFLLTVNNSNYGVDSAARRYSYDWFRSHPITGAANVGGGVAFGTILTMLSRAMALVSATVPPLGFFASEPEALAWIADQRRKLPARRPAT
jgi:hypothetical protein